MANYPKRYILFIFSLLLHYMSYAQTITTTGSMHVSRWFHQSVILANGNMLSCGGNNGNAISSVTYNSSEIYNVATGTWSYTGNMKERRMDFAAITLNNGKVLVIGGHPDMTFTGGKKSCEIYDPATGIWTYTDSMNYSRYLHHAIKLNDGKILVAGGYSDNTTAEIYNPDTDKWTITGNLNYLLDENSSTVKLADGKIFTSNGQNGEIYDPYTGLWTTTTQLNGDRRSHSSVLLNDGRVLLSGSSFPADQNTAEIFDPVAGTFTTTGSMAEYRAHSPAILMDNGKVLAFGIGDLFNPSDTKLIEIFDPATGVWTSATYSSIGTQGYTINKLNNGKILVAGGSFTTGNGASATCFLIDQNLGACTNPNLSLLINGGIICANSNGTIEVIATEVGASYQAYIGDNPVSNVISGGSTINFTINADFIRAGENIVSIEVKKASCPSMKLNDTATLKIFQPTIISDIPSLHICQGDSITLSAPVGFNSYLWSNGATSSSIKIKTAGTFTVQVDNGLCISPASLAKQIIVNPIVPVSVNISITNGSNPGVSGNPVTFTAAPVNGGQASNFDWKVNNISTGVHTLTFTSSTLTDNDVVSCVMTPDTVCPDNSSSTSNTIIYALSNAPGVVSQNPAANTYNASVNASLSTTFSRTMDVASSNDTVITVHGNATGKIQGIFNNTNSPVITFDPTRTFYPGEKIQMSIKSKAKTSSGDTLSKPYISEFTVASGSGSGTFFTSLASQATATNPSQIASADFDHDGDIDIAIAANSSIVTIGKNNGAGIFTLTNLTIYATGGDVLVKDFNNDGYADIAVVSFKTVVAINDGSGNFPTLKTSIFTGSPSVWGYCSGDFNGDGFLDIAMADKGAGIHVYLNDGTAIFTRIAILSSSLVQTVTSGDIDQDGDIDIITANDNTVSVFVNDGKADYTFYVSTTVSAGARSVELSDLDKDGDLDIITGNYSNSNTVSIRKNNGGGTFGSLTNLSLGALTNYLCVADFDGDGNPDIATGNGTIGVANFSVTFNDGSGSFVRSLNYANGGTNPTVTGICSADFDGDGDMDLAVANSALNTFNIRLNQAPTISTGFVPDSYYCAGATFTVPYTTSGTFLPGNNFRVELSNASGSFTTPVIIGTGTSSPITVNIPGIQTSGNGYKIRVTSVYPTVVNGAVSVSFEIATCPAVLSNYPLSNQIHIPNDTIIEVTFSQPMDLSTVNGSSFRVTGSLQGNIPGNFVQGSSSDIIRFIPLVPYKAGEKISVSLNNNLKNSSNHILLKGYVFCFMAKSKVASGNLTFANNLKEGDFYPVKFTKGYIRDHNHLDIIARSYNLGGLGAKDTHFKNDGPGTFIPDSTSLPGMSSVLADFDNDNDLDAATINFSYLGLKIFKQGADHVFTSSLVTTSNEVTEIKTADIDGDADIDIIVTGASPRIIEALINDGSGNFTISSTVTISDAPYGLDVTDLDKDGDIDIVSGNTNGGSISILTNNGKGVYTLKSTILSAAGARSIRCVDLDNDKDADIIAGHLGSSDFCIFHNDGTASFTKVNYNTSGITQYFDLGDLDGDGDIDMVQAIYNANAVLIHKNDGNGNFSLSYSLPHNPNPDLMVVDIDEDGDQDLVVTSILARSAIYVSGNFIKTNAISKNICLPQTSLPVSYTCESTLNPGNVFTAELSDKYGNFANATIVGTLNSNTSGTINVNLPISLPAGNAYRIRVVSSDPVVPSQGTNDSLCIASLPPVFNQGIVGATETCYGISPTNTYVLPYQEDLNYTWSDVGSYYIKKYKNTFEIAWKLTPDTVDIICKVSNGCGSLPPISKTVKLFFYVSTPAITGPKNICANQTGVVYSIPVVNGATGYAWTVPTGSTIVSGAGTNSITVNFGSTAGNITASASNVCGSPDIATFAVVIGPAGNAGSISGPTNLCANQTNVNYSIVPVSKATGYNWSLPPGATIISGANTWNIRVNFGSTSGNITVTPINSCGNGSSSITPITINSVVPSATGSISGINLPCYFQTGVSYSVTPVTGASGYTWTLPSGASIASGTNSSSITVDFTVNSGNITVTPTNGCGNGPSSSLPITMNNNQPDNAGTITGANTVCANQSGVTYNISSVLYATGYNWSLPAGATITGGANTTAITVNFGSSAGTVKVIPINACGNGNSSSKSVSINGTAGSAGAITGVTTVCANQTSVSYSITPVSGANSYSWTLPSGASITSGLNTQSIIVNIGSTSGNITVTPTNASCGNGTPSSVSINVNSIPGTAGTINGNTSVCANANGLTYNITPVSGASGYDWSLPSGSTITSGNNTTNITITYGGVAGNITVLPINNCGNGTASSLAVNTYTGSCTLPPAQTISGPSSLQQGTTANYSVATPVTGSTYSWQIQSGSTIISATSDSSSITIYMGTNSGNIVLKETNIAGTTSNSLFVNAVPPTGTIDAITSKQIEVYPLPFEDVVTMNISSEGNYDLKIRILNTKGVEVYTSDSFFTNEPFIIGKSLSTGIYYAEVKYSNVVKIIRLVKI